MGSSFGTALSVLQSRTMATSPLLLGKSVLVTGSTSGIGWSIATQFVKAGARVMLQGLEKESEVGHLISQLGSISPSSQVAYTQADLSSEKSCNHLIAHTSDTFKSLDILINNAGIQYTSRVEDYPTDKWDSVLKLNLYAPFFLSRAALPGM
jgi:3-hydroxybutyrate dehydrogenase